MDFSILVVIFARDLFPIRNDPLNTKWVSIKGSPRTDSSNISSSNKNQHSRLFLIFESTTWIQLDFTLLVSFGFQGCWLTTQRPISLLLPCLALIILLHTCVLLNPSLIGLKCLRRGKKTKTNLCSLPVLGSADLAVQEVGRCDSFILTCDSAYFRRWYR